MASSELLVSEGKKGVSSTVPPKPQQHKRMPSTLQGEEDLFYLLFLACRFYKLLDVLYGSSVALIIAPLCVWLLGAARCPWPHYDPHFLHQKDYAHLFRKQFTWGRNVSAFSLLVLRTTLILNLVQILVFGRHMTINMMILNTLIFALGLCGVRLSRARGGDIVSGTCSTTTGRHGAQPQPQLDEETSLGVDSGCSCSSQGLEQQVRRTADVPRPDLRDSAPACAAASSSPPCKNNASESAVDTAANPHRSADDHEEPALPKGGEITPPSPAKTAHAWVIDTGASFHTTGDRELLRDLRPSVLSERLLMASGLHLPVVGTGSVQTDRITLPNVRYAPGLLVNLISVAQLCAEHSLATFFEPHVLYIKKTASAEIIGQGSVDGSGLYVLDYLHLTGTACRTSTGSHPYLDAEAGRTTDVPQPDLRDSAPACAAASSSPPCKNNASESAVDTAANPRRSANDHEEPALPIGGEIIPPSPAKTAHAWVVDAGAPCHVTGDRELLRDLHPPVLSEELFAADGQRLPVVGTGSVQTDRITLPNVRYVPGLVLNLISVVQLSREHSLVTIFEPDVLYIKKTASAEIIGQASVDGNDLYVLDYLHLTGTACRTSTGSHPHLDAEAEPCGTDSGHSSSSQSTGTGTAQQAMPAYACSTKDEDNTKDEDQMPVALIAPSSTQAGGYPEVFLDSGASFHMTGFGEALQNPEHKPMDFDVSSSTQAGGDLVVVLDSGAGAEIIGQASVDGRRRPYLHLTGTSTGSHPHLDAEDEPCGIDSGHSSSQSTGTGTAQQAMLAYACSTKDEDQMPVALTVSSSSQAGGDLEVFLDSGCSFHMTGCGEVLQNREDMTGSVLGISGTPLPITGLGSIMGTPVPIWLDKVRYVHGLRRLLVSVSQLTRERSARVIFEHYCCRVERMSDNCMIGQGKMVGDLYTLEFLERG